jgi:hypothetical protein
MFPQARVERVSGSKRLPAARIPGEPGGWNSELRNLFEEKRGTPLERRFGTRLEVGSRISLSSRPRRSRFPCTGLASLAASLVSVLTVVDWQMVRWRAKLEGAHFSLSPVPLSRTIASPGVR